MFIDHTYKNKVNNISSTSPATPASQDKQLHLASH